jgi:hypothetical protein
MDRAYISGKTDIYYDTAGVDSTPKLLNEIMH